MQDPKLPIQASAGEPMPVPMFSSVPAGFPSPAGDFFFKQIDIGAELVKHPKSTYLLTIAGLSMRDIGLHDGDIVVIDRSLEPKHGSIVIAVVDGEFTCKKLYRKGGITKLQPANPDFEEITFRDGQTLEIWGVVTSSIKQFPI